MAFWGVEIKPGKSHTHVYDDARGRLHISQAVLGLGSGTKRSVVECNVGSKSPLRICSLLPDTVESCPLDLEFEEDDEVVFSVTGPRSVHLSGYYLGPSGGLDQDGDDTDSYGEDIAETGSDESSDYDIEDEYDDDFIVDSDIDMFHSSPRPKSGVRIEEIIDDEKLANGNSTVKHPKKDNQCSEPDDDDSQHQIVVKRTGAQVFESEDEDGFPLSLTSKSKAPAKNVNTTENLDTKTDVATSKKEKEKRRKDKKEDDNGRITGSKRKNDAIDQAGEEESEAKHLGDSSEPVVEVAAEKGGKSKKKKKEKAEKKTPELEADVSKLETKKAIGDQNGAIDDNNGDTPNDLKLHLPNSKTGDMDQDAGVGDEPKESLPNDKSPVVDAESAAADSQNASKKKKKKKKKSKTNDCDAAGSNGIESGKVLTEVEKNPMNENAEQKVEVQPTKARTFSNGLVIEELSMGKPDGKRASPGKKVSVYYIGRLKKNGQIFDSNIGQRPFKFRLGIGQVIKGWDVGVAGMRIGDKRRLTIPPSMGYGSKGVGKIPANAWLVFDVELVDVM